MYYAQKNNKSLSRQGLGRSPLERVAAPSLFLHRISVVRMYLYIATTTPDPAGWDLRHLAHPHHLTSCQGPSQPLSYIDLHQVPPKRSRTNTPSGQFKTTSEQYPVSSTNSTSKGRSWQVSKPTEASSTSCGQHLHSSLNTVRVQLHSHLP